MKFIPYFNSWRCVCIFLYLASSNHCVCSPGSTMFVVLSLFNTICHIDQCGCCCVWRQSLRWHGKLHDEVRVDTEVLLVNNTLCVLHLSRLTLTLIRPPHVYLRKTHASCQQHDATRWDVVCVALGNGSPSGASVYASRCSSHESGSRVISSRSYPQWACAPWHSRVRWSFYQGGIKCRE